MKFAIIFFLMSLPGWAKWSVSTYNIRNFDNDGGSGRTDLVLLGKILHDVQSDVMGFQEIVNKDAFGKLVKTNLNGYEYKLSSCGGFGKQHLAIVYDSKTFEYVRQFEDLSFSGEENKCGNLRPAFLVTLKEKSTSKIYTFGALHLKAGSDARAFEQRWKQYLKLEKLGRSHEMENLILLGDFNTTGYNIKDQDFQKFENFISSSQMRTMTETLGCTNYWRGKLGGEEYQSSVLDHILVQDKNLSSVSSVKLGAHCAELDCRPATPAELGPSYQVVSDHCPIQVNFK